MKGRPDDKWKNFELVLQEEADEIRKKEKTLTDTDTRPPLIRHMDYFGGVNADQAITPGSIYDKNIELGDNFLEAGLNAISVSGFAGYYTNGCPFSPFTSRKAVPHLMHPFATGLYNKDATINEERWNELCDYAIDTQFEDGRSEYILTREGFNKFLNTCRVNEKSMDKFAKMTSDLEWAKFWKKYGETLPGSIGIEYIPLGKMRTFLEDPEKLEGEVKERITQGMKI